MSEENKELSVEELATKNALLEQEKQGLVEEIKNDRQKKNEEIKTLQEALEAATKANQVKENPNDIASVVQTILNQRDASTAESNKKLAVEKFVSGNKEFSPENDVTGKRREALASALSRFNTEGLHSVEDFTTVIRDAATLLGVNTALQTPGEIASPYAASTRTPITPQIANETDVSNEEKKLYEKNGWTKEKFLQLKSKNPKFIENLVKIANSL